MWRQATMIAAAAVLSFGTDARSQVDDDLKCYKIKDPLRLSGVVDLDTPQFGPESGCIVSSAKLFCVPATRTVVSAQDRATGATISPLPVSAAPAPGDRICYKVRCPSPLGTVPDQLATDQFGTRTLSKLKAAMVCTPAVKGTGWCGDGTIDAGEECEGPDLDGATCRDFDFRGGTLACGPGCRLDTSGCRPVSTEGPLYTPALFPGMNTVSCPVTNLGPDPVSVTVRLFRQGALEPFDGAEVASAALTVPPGLSQALNHPITDLQTHYCRFDTTADVSMLRASMLIIGDAGDTLLTVSAAAPWSPGTGILHTAVSTSGGGNSIACRIMNIGTQDVSVAVRFVEYNGAAFVGTDGVLAPGRAAWSARVGTTLPLYCRFTLDPPDVPVIAQLEVMHPDADLADRHATAVLIAE